MRRFHLQLVLSFLVVALIMMQWLLIALLVGLGVLAISIVNTTKLPGEVEELLIAAYEQGRNESLPKRRNGKHANIVSIYVEAYNLARTGLELHIPPNQDPKAPKEVLLGRKGSSPINPKKKLFFPVAKITEKGIELIQYPELDEPSKQDDGSPVVAGVWNDVLVGDGATIE